MLYDPEKGAVILIHKPIEWTSFDVVNKLRYAVIKNLRQNHPELFEGIKHRPKVGHAGTLDPLATGLLIVCAGKETKNIDRYMGMEKEYTGSFFLGTTTPSLDRETEPAPIADISHITPELIKQAAASLTGDLQQIPPVYSAIKKEGKRAYSSAREGKEIVMEPRSVNVREFEITSINLPLVGFRITCSKGTYIRSLARDFGIALSSSAFLDSLCRTRIGNFSLVDAWDMDKAVAELLPE